tara:strand:- start:599 stop:1318 length:720 start_codon:yes stop_codon:yes gene_type:complete
MILAGGKGTRFAEYTDKIPKPMILANGKPLLDHIISIYSKFNIKNIVILAGYKKEKIIEHYESSSKRVSKTEDIFEDNLNTKISVLDTGLETMTGGRLKIGAEYLDEESFYLTYGDGIANIQLDKLTQFFIEQKTIATVTAVRPPARFGSLEIDNNLVTNFGEKDNTSSGWINGGFFVFKREILNYLTGLEDVLERKPLELLATEKELSAFKHEGFWQPCDTIRELEILEKAMESGLVN